MILRLSLFYMETEIVSSTRKECMKQVGLPELNLRMEPRMACHQRKSGFI